MDVSGLPFWLQWYCNRLNKRKKKLAQTSGLPFLLQWYCNRQNKLSQEKPAQTSGLLIFSLSTLALRHYLMTRARSMVSFKAWA